MTISNISYQEKQTQSQFKDFMNFKIMITPSIIKVIFILGVIGIFIFSFVFVLTGVFKGKLSGVEDLFAFLLFVLIIATSASIIWRIFCEMLILFFSIHETLVSMEKSLHGVSTTGGSTLFPEEGKSPNVCPICGATIPPNSSFCPNCGYKIK